MERLLRQHMKLQVRMLNHTVYSFVTMLGVGQREHHFGFSILTLMVGLRRTRLQICQGDGSSWLILVALALSGLRLQT
jgi:predicted RNA-binding Zn ribbon-like protein